MGNIPNTSIVADYRQCKKQQNDYLGKLKYIHHQHNHSNSIVKQYSFQNQMQYQLFINQLRKKKALSNQKMAKYIVNVEDIQCTKTQQICGVSFTIYCILEYFQTDFEAIFRHRQSTSSYFSEVQILKILQSTCQGLIMIYDNNLKAYPICRECLVYNSIGYKIIDLDLVEAMHPYFRILLMASVNKNTYIAPQLLHELRQKNKQPYFSPKCDVFSLGMFILELCRLEQLNNVYNYQEFWVDLQNVNIMIEDINYSQNIKSILRIMVEESPQDRIGLVSLREKIDAVKLERSNSQNLRNRTNSQINLSTKPNLHRNTIISNESMSLTNQQSFITNRENISPAIQNKQKKILQATFNRKNTLTILKDINNSHTKEQKSSILLKTPKDQKQFHSSEDNTPIRKIQQIQFDEQPDKNQKYIHMRISTGQYYQGEINQKGKFDGNGILYYPSGKKKYSGTWLDGLFHGFGILNNYQPQTIIGYQINYNNFSHNTNNIWTHYQGQFCRGFTNGFGTIYYSNGQKFSGCFQEGFACGFGTFYKSNGQIVNGVWMMNQLKQ